MKQSKFEFKLSLFLGILACALHFKRTINICSKRALAGAVAIILSVNISFTQSNPGLGDVSDSFYDTFDDSSVDESVWTIMDQVWSTNNGGVVPENVSETDGCLKIEAHGNYYTGSVTGHDQNIKVGGAIKTTEKMQPGTYEVRAKICPQLGAVSAFWTYDYGTDGQTGYSEIDFETPGDSSLDKIICTNYSTETSYTSQVVPVTQNDGDFHIYKFEWFPASVTDTPYVKYYFDSVLIASSNTNIPEYDAQFTIGVWFPNGWAGTPNFDTDYMYVDWVKITPAEEETSNISCSITSPSEGDTYVSGDDVTINVSASTNSGYISAVEFYNDGTYLGTDNSSSFSYTISDITSGTHILEAVAYSSTDLYAVSEAVNISVSSEKSTSGSNTTDGLSDNVENTSNVSVFPNLIIDNVCIEIADGLPSTVEFYTETGLLLLKTETSGVQTTVSTDQLKYQGLVYVKINDSSNKNSFFKAIIE